LQKGKHGARRSTRLSLEIPVVIASLDPACDFHQACKTVIVSLHGCGVIVPERPKNETPVMVKLASNGASKKGRIVLAVPLLENLSWLLGVEFDTPGNFWQVENPPADWRSEGSTPVLPEQAS
jgi:hypothetical protein